jgi:myotubularin-related protein 5/13
MFVIPKNISDECIRKNAKCHRQNRLPIIVWRHPQAQSLLLRSSSFLGKGIIGMLMKGQTTSSK